LDFIDLEVDMEVEYEKIEFEMYKEAQTPLMKVVPLSNSPSFYYY
jgi:hypothetical protein